MIKQLVLVSLLLVAPAAHAGAWTGPLFDAHLHYNDDAVERYPIGTVRELFDENGIGAIIANSRPNDGTRALHAAAAGWKRPAVVPFIRVYRTRADYGTWQGNPEIYQMIVAEEKRGFYRGIGEFHVNGRDADTPVMKQIVDFAVARGLVLHAHCDEQALEILFAHNPKARVIWAHTGFGTPLARLDELFAKYPALWGELSYRFDVVEEGRLTPAWKAFFERHPKRFMVGSDTWVNQRWQGYPEIMGGYRRWLGELAPAAARRIAWENGAELFGLK